MLDNSNFKSIRISIASPEKIKEWAGGREVTKSETINYRTLKPEKGGLFCEVIFGPMKDYECSCGRYKRSALDHKRNGVKECETCHVPIEKSSVRRERMGYIHLARPVVHTWYQSGSPCYLKMLLGISPDDLKDIIYYTKYVVLDAGSCADSEFWQDHSADGSGKHSRDELSAQIVYKQVIEETTWQKIRPVLMRKKIENPAFIMPVVGMGAEAIRKLLCDLDLEAERMQLRSDIEATSGQKATNLKKRLEVIEAFIKSGNKPEWVVLENLPVIPPDLRPMVQLDGGRFATSDLNDLYRKVINRNNRLKKMIKDSAPDVMLRSEMCMLQQAVDALIDNDKKDKKKSTTGPGNRPLKSLTSMLKGKQGRFRQNLLGKRVDYSGRSVIVVGPELKMYQCGLPKEMALELFKPFVIMRLTTGPDKTADITLKGAKGLIERADDRVWKALEEVIKDHPVLLNRAPTLHRLGIQAFEPVLVEGRAIKLHPLVCTAYNADFDGDQMAVHVPLSIEAQAEARFLMLASNNILKPQDGKPVVCPTQDMVLGCYYLTSVRERAGRKEGDPLPAYYCPDEAMYAYQTGNVTLQEPIKVRVEREFTVTENGEEKTVTRRKTIVSTVGKLIFNEIIPQDLGYVDRTDESKKFGLEIDFQVKKGDLSKIIDRCYRIHGAQRTSEMLDKIKALGYKYSTRAGITVGYKDVVIPTVKSKKIEEAENSVRDIEELYREGFFSDAGRKALVVKIWSKTTEELADISMKGIDEFNPIYLMADSGARGSKKQISQLCGMRGNMQDTRGETIEVPIKSNFREGLTVLEFFISSHGTRKTLSDTALKTADSGYLTRRLVDVAQDVVVREDDCFAKRKQAVKGAVIEAIVDGGKVVVPLAERLRGRYTVHQVIHPETGELIIDANQRITIEIADKIVKAGITKVECRTVLECLCEHGVCRKCYGENLATGNDVEIGEAVGIIAAQAIGEPGTQLTMRTFHTGGVSGATDITSGLPRVEEIFEARQPNPMAVLARVSGTVSAIKVENGQRKIYITPDGTGASDTDAEGGKSAKGSRSAEKKEREKNTKYPIEAAAKILVKVGDHVERGDRLTNGAQSPSDILSVLDIAAAQKYMLEEVHKVYRSQEVSLADKHIEIIIRQMTRKVYIEDAGDTDFSTGEIADRFAVNRANEAINVENENGMLRNPDGYKKKVRARFVERLLGITKASLATDSFLSAAAFQETTRNLTDAAVRGKKDPLVGLKENIIIGKLIPAGLGMPCYRDAQIENVDETDTPAADAGSGEPESETSMDFESMSQDMQNDTHGAAIPYSMRDDDEENGGTPDIDPAFGNLGGDDE